MRILTTLGILLVLAFINYEILKAQKTDTSPQRQENNLLLPDLKLNPPGQLFIEESEEGRFILFDTAFINQGKGPLEVQGQPDDTGEKTKAVQKILKKDGTFEIRSLGEFILHPEHDHWHIEKYSVFELWSLKGGREKDKLLAATDKLSFCLWDEYEYDLKLENAPNERKYTGVCSNEVQGISVGWSDAYEADVEGQELNINDIPDGSYLLRSVINPDRKIVESDYNNNEATVIVKIEGADIEPE